MSIAPPPIRHVLCTRAGEKPTWLVSWDVRGNEEWDYAVALFDGAGKMVGSALMPVMGSEVSFTAPVALDPAKAYFVRVATFQGNHAGPWSPAGVPALFVPPTGLTVDFDGTKVEASWTDPPAGSVPAGGRITLAWTAAGRSDQLSAVVEGTEGSFAPGIRFDPGTSYAVTVSPVLGKGTGPASAPVALVQERPPVAYLSNPNPPAPLLGPAPPGPFPVEVGTPVSTLDDPTLVVTLYVDGQPGEPRRGTASRLTVGENGFWALDYALPAAPAAGVDYRFTLRLVSGASTGPEGTPGSMLTAAPVFAGVSLAPGAGSDTVSVALDFPPDAAATGAVVTVLDDGGHPVGQGYVAGRQGAVATPSKLAPGAAYTVRASLARGLPGGLSSGPPAAVSPAVLTSPVAPTSAAYDGAALTVEWPAVPDPGAAGYLVSVRDGEALVAQLQASASPAVLPLAAAPGKAYTVGVRSAGAATSGPAGTTLSPVTSAPAVAGTAYDAGTKTVAVSWKTVADASCGGYSLQLFHGEEAMGPPVAVSGRETGTGSVVVAQALDASAGYSVRVRGTGTGVSGPWSTPAPVVAAVPPAPRVEYDGATLRAEWDPVSAPCLTGYRVTLRSAADPAKNVSVVAGGTSAEIPLAAAGASGTYSVVVQALCGGATGTASPAAEAVAPGWSLSTARESAPAILPAGASLPPTPWDVTVHLPQLYDTPPRTLPSSGAFALAAGSGDFPYTLVFRADGPAWSFDASPVRAALRQGYLDFLLMLEGTLSGQDPATIGVLRKGAVQAVQAAISRAMPQTFAETLFYAYGLSPAEDRVDLRAGMRLRVAFQNFQYVGSNPPLTTPGFAGGAVAEYDVSAYPGASGSPLLGFDAFLAQLQGMDVPAPTGSGSGPFSGGAGAVDFLFPGFRQPFYRVFYPSTFASASRPGSGYLQDNVALAAASTWSVLATVTRAFDRNQAGTLGGSGNGYALTYLRGRAVLEPLVQVGVNGSPQWVPVGTTLGQLLQRDAADPLGLPATLRGLRLRRARGTAVLDPAEYGSGLEVGGAGPVRLGWGPSVVYAAGGTWLDLPVLHGDRVDFGGRG